MARSFVILVGILVLASGCSGKKAAPIEEEEQSGVFGQTVPGNSTVQGRVVSEELLPIPGVSVKIAAIGQINNVTDEQGNFTLWNVPPGAHVVLVQQPGFIDGRLAIRPEADQLVKDLQFVLKPIQTKGEAFVETFVNEGLISCGWSHPVVGQPEQVSTTCNADSNHDPDFEFNINHQAGLFALVLELAWEPVSPATGVELQQGLWLDHTCDQNGCRSDAIVGNIQGPSPLKNQFGSLQRPLSAFYNENNPQRSASIVQLPIPERFPEGDFTKFHPTVQQPFTHYISVFYNSEPSRDYTLIPT